MRSSLGGAGSVRSGHGFDEQKLEAYLKAHLSALFVNDTVSSGLSSVQQFEAGQSNPTFLLTLSNHTKLILRKKPPGVLLPSAHAIEREYRILAALAHTSVPVPRVYHLCTDNEVIGTPFYIMEALDGRVFKDPALPGLTPIERRSIYQSMIETLVAIHKVDWRAIGLVDFGKQEQYYSRQISRWIQQYVKSIPSDEPPHLHSESMKKLMAWLPNNISPAARDAAECTIVHGDFRLENLIFHPTQPRVIAVLDWELSTLGHPLSDLAYNATVYYLKPEYLSLQGLGHVGTPESSEAGIPTEEQLVEHYCKLTDRSNIMDWNFYLAFSLFRAAGIAYGVRARALRGNASSQHAAVVGGIAGDLADLGWHQAATPRNIHLARTIPGSSSVSAFLKISDRGQEYFARVKQFMDDHVYPNEMVFFSQLNAAPSRWTIPPIMDELKDKAKKAGLWNLFLPDSHYGAGLTNLEYSRCCELMGRSFIAPEIFNCAAPDTGNMEVLVRYGTPEQQKEWLIPLLEGRIRSCFAMTEPAVASSDATNISTEIKRFDDHYLINGVKWWTSGAGDPRCKIAILMGRSAEAGGSVPIHRQQSMILVPMDAPGVTIVRPLTVFGYDDAPHGHCEVRFENVKVPLSNMLLGEGRGFEIAQGRLGPGRIHHAMRTIGMAERALEALMDRAVSRVAFGRRLAEHASVGTDVAKCRCEIDQARLLTMQAAYMMDTVGNKAAQSEIAQIKVVAPNMALAVIDRAIQVHGGAGVSQDFFLAYAWAAIRTLRIADGPDEVHLRAIGRLEFKKRFGTSRL